MPGKGKGMHVASKGLILLAACSLPLAAQAALIDGDQLIYQGYSSTSGYTPYGGSVYYQAGSVPGAGIPGVSTPEATLTSSGNVVTIDFTSSFNVPACATGSSCIEGGSLSVGSQAVTAATINSSASSSIFDSVSSPVIGAQQGVAFVQLQGLDVAAGDKLVFTVNATPVPLPAALPLLLSGVAGVAGVGTVARRRRISLA